MIIVGLVGVKNGPLMASSDRFNIIVRGQGGHGAVPGNTHNTYITSPAGDIPTTTLIFQCNK